MKMRYTQKAPQVKPKDRVSWWHNGNGSLTASARDLEKPERIVDITRDEKEITIQATVDLGDFGTEKWVTIRVPIEQVAVLFPLPYAENTKKKP